MYGDFPAKNTVYTPNIPYTYECMVLANPTLKQAHHRRVRGGSGRACVCASAASLLGAVTCRLISRSLSCSMSSTLLNCSSAPGGVLQRQEAKVLSPLASLISKEMMLMSSVFGASFLTVLGTRGVAAKTRGKGRDDDEEKRTWCIIFNSAWHHDCHQQ